MATLTPGGTLGALAAMAMAMATTVTAKASPECGPTFQGDPGTAAIAVLHDFYRFAATGDEARSRLTSGLAEALEERRLSGAWLVEGLTSQALQDLEIFDMYGARSERAILYARTGDHRREYRMVCLQGHWRIEQIWSEATGSISG